MRSRASCSRPRLKAHWLASIHASASCGWPKTSAPSVHASHNHDDNVSTHSHHSKHHHDEDDGAFLLVHFILRYINEAKKFVIENGITKITLTTAKTNQTAQCLYEAEGYIKENEYLVYNLEIK